MQDLDPESTGPSICSQKSGRVVLGFLILILCRIHTAGQISSHIKNNNEEKIQNH